MKKPTPVTIDSMSNLSVDDSGQIYWRNQKVITTHEIKVSFLVNLAIYVTALATVVQAITAVIQLFR